MTDQRDDAAGDFYDSWTSTPEFNSQDNITIEGSVPAWTPERFSSPEEQERWFKKVQMTIAWDFDGVIHPYTDGWQGPVPSNEPPIPGVAAALRTWQRRGFRNIVFSTRAEMPEGLAGIEAWLEKEGLTDYVDEVTNKKPPAIAYVDDRAVSFQGNWEDVHKGIERLAGGPVHGAAR